ncbi:MAG: sortase domain-containing protein, partial [Anaerolineae bacterium]
MSKKVGTALLLFGLVALAAAAGMVGYDQVQRALMRKQVAALRLTPVATPIFPGATLSPTAPEPMATEPPTVPVPTATPSPRTPMAAPSPTVPQMTPTPTQAGPLPQGGTATSTPVLPTRGPAEALPTPTDTPVSPTPASPAPPLPSARPVRMAVPAIGLDIPVVEVAWVVEERNGVRSSTWETASYAAGHHVGSANPGEPGNVVLSGHHNMEGEVFREISSIGEPGARLRVGDEVVLYRADGLAFVYRIVEWH